MVTAQEEMIQRIDSDLDDTMDNTKKAQEGQFQHTVLCTKTLPLLTERVALLPNIRESVTRV